MFDLLVVNMSGSPIYSANENRFAIVKTVLLLYDLSVINYKRSNYGIYKNRNFKEVCR